MTVRRGSAPARPGLVGISLLITAATLANATPDQAPAPNVAKQEPPPVQGPGDAGGRLEQLVQEAIQQSHIMYEGRVSRRAMEILKRAEQMAGQDPTLYPTVAKGYYWARSLADAERLLTRALASGKLAADSMALRLAQEYMGRILLRRGEGDRAEALLKAAAAGVEQANEQDPSLYYGCPYQALGELYYARDQPTAAMHALHRAADLELINGQSQFSAARASVEVGDLRSAVRYFQRALALCESRREGALYLAWVEILTRLRRQVRAGAAPYHRVEVHLHLAAHLLVQPMLASARRAVARLLGLTWLPGGGSLQEGVLERAAMDRRLEMATSTLAGELLPNDASRSLAAAVSWLYRQLVGAPARGQAEAPSLAPGLRRTCLERVVDQTVAAFLDNDFALADQVAGDLLGLPAGHVPPSLRRTLLAVRGYTLLVKKEYPKAGELFRRLEHDPEARSYAHVGGAHLAIVRQDYATAARLLAPVITSAEADIRATVTAPSRWLAYRMARLGLAWAAANQNENRAAMSHYQKILRHRPDDLFALLGMGNSLTAVKQMARAERHFRRVLALDPRNAFAHAEMGLLHYNRGDDAAAMRAFKQALLQESKRYTCPYEGMGLVYLRQGKIEAARRNFKRAISIAPDIEYKKYNGLAKILIREGKVARARKLLRKSLKNYPHDPEARRLLSSLPAEQ